MAISSLGVGSGLDLNSLVEGLLSAERVPVEERLNKKEFKLQSELSAFGALSSTVSELQTALNPLKDITEGRTGTSSDSSIISVSVDETSSVGSYTVTANQLAEADSLASSAFADPAAVVGEGTLTFNFGTKGYDGSDNYNAFTANPDKSATTITIDSSNNTLEGIRDAINDADFGVNAVIVNDGTGSRLLLTSEDSGAANGIDIEVSTTSGDLSPFEYNFDGVSATENMQQTVKAQDAQITVNGLALTSSSNTFADSLPGVTLDVKEASATPVAVDIALDKGSVKNAFNTFIAAYNKLIENLDALSKFNPDTGQGSVLTGDSLVRGIKSNVRNQLITDFGQSGDAIQTFVDLGIKTGADGKLSIDSEIFDAAVDNNFDGVIAFANSAGESLDSLTETYLGSGGTINSRQESIQQGIEDISDERLALEDRLARIESSLIKKYSALDTLLSGLQQTSSFISSQLATLDFSNNSSK
jgi:flagellar hook-associated protein 2